MDDDDPLSDHGREDEDEEEDEAVLRGRVRPHAVVQGSNGLELDDGRHKSLAEKGWARRAVVVRGVGPCGGADLEELPGREEYGEIKKVPSAGMVCQLQVIGKHATERLQGL